MSLQRQGLKVDPGLAVGTTFLRPLHQVTETGTLPEDAASDVPRLYGVALVMQNPDRRASNPNCALYEEKLLAYDFELAFSFLMAVGNAFEAWEVSKHGLSAQHIFYPRLRKQRPDWSPLLASLRELTAERLDELIGCLPADWQGDVQRIRTHLISLLGCLDDLEQELQESVA
jgi:hypothetical protein